MESRDSVIEESTDATTPEPATEIEEKQVEEQSKAKADDEDDLDDWLRELPSPTTGELGTRRNPTDADGALPTWLQEVRATADEQSPAGENGLVDWLTDPEDDESPPTAAGQSGEALPDWVAALTKPEQWPETDDPESMAEWFADAEVAEDSSLPQTAELPLTRPLDPSQEMDGIPGQLAGDSLPDWLMNEAGAEGGPDSADYHPSGRKPTIGPAANQPPPDESSLAHAGTEPVQENQLSGQPPSEADELIVVGAAALSEAAETDEELGWLEDIEDQDVKTGLDEILNPEEVAAEIPPTTPATGEWLDILDDVPDAEVPDTFSEPALTTDLDIEPAEIPDWLKALKPDEPGQPKTRSFDGPQEVTGPLTGLRGVVPVAIAATGAAQMAGPAKFEITKEQQQQVALLKQLTIVVPEHGLPKAVTGEVDRFGTERLVLGLLLLLIVLIGLFLPVDRWLPFLSSWTPSEATSAVYQAIDQVEGEGVLLAFEYTPAMAGELDVIADSLLVQLAANDSPVFTVSQAAAGVVMAENALERSAVSETYDLGFLPGDAVGLRGLGSCLSTNSDCTSMVGLSLNENGASLIHDISLVIILTGDRDSLVNWIEQVGVQIEAPMTAGLTQALIPVSAPYMASDQLVGVVEGAPASASYDYSQDETDNDSSQLLTSLTLAQWLVIGVLIAGSLYFGIVRRS